MTSPERENGSATVTAEPSAVREAAGRSTTSEGTSAQDIARAMAVRLHALGWNVLPLPTGRKALPPSGTTGANGQDLPLAEVSARIGAATSNLGVRMPADVLGLDADQYSSKTGFDSLMNACQGLGDLPPTWRSTSRGAENPSGIRFFRVPEGLHWSWPVSRFGGALDVIQRAHRYAVVAPSTHPEGRMYQWFDADGAECDPPAVEDLPRLPDAWVSALSQQVSAERSGSGASRPDPTVHEINSWLDRKSVCCLEMQRALDDKLGSLADPSLSAHDVAMGAAVQVTALQSEGHVGTMKACRTLRRAFIANVTRADRSGSVRTTESADAEFLNLLGWAVAAAREKPQAEPCSCAEAQVKPKRQKSSGNSRLDWAAKLHEQAPFAVPVDPESGALFRYGGGIFRPTSSARIGTDLALLLKEGYDRGDLATVADHCRALARDSGLLLDESEPSRLIAVPNGSLDPQTGELVPHSADQRLTSRWETVWDPSATCERILEYLDLRATEQVDCTLNTLARCLNRVDPQDRVLYLFGPPRSGKSTLLRIAQTLVGPENCSAATLRNLNVSRWSPAQLYNKSINVAADISAEDMADLSVFKSITGGDLIEAEKKFGQPFNFVSHALLIFSGNEIPAMPAGSFAEHARFVPVCFGRSFIGAEDPSIEAGLLAELPGLFAELVRRFQSGAKPEALPHVRAEFHRRSDRIAQFVEERLTLLSDDEPTSEGALAPAVMEAFRNWSYENSGRATQLGRNRFYQLLSSYGLGTHESHGARVRARILPGGRPPGSAFDDWVRATFM